MAAMSQYLEDALINAVFRGATFTSPASLWLSLHTSAGANETTAAWASTELSSTTAVNYTRIEAPLSAWSGASGGLTILEDDALFGSAGSAWGTITHVGIWDSATGGNLLFWAELIIARVVNSGDQVAFFADNLSVSLD